MSNNNNHPTTDAKFFLNIMWVPKVLDSKENLVYKSHLADYIWRHYDVNRLIV